MKGLILTFALSYGGALVSLARPFVGFLIYVSFAIIKPNALWEYSVPAGNYSRIVFGGLFLGWLVAGGGTWRFGRARASIVALTFYLLWNVLSAFGAADQPLAWNTVESTAKAIIPILIGLTLIESRTQLRQLAWVIVVSQGFLAFEFNVSYYEGFNRLTTVGFAGMEEKTVAMTMIVGAAVALFLGLTERRLLVKVAILALAALMIHVPLFTFSRGGIMALIAVGVLSTWLIPKRPVHVLVLAGAILLGLRLAGPAVRTFFLTSFAEEENRDGSAQSRIDLWGQAWETTLRRPLLGVGPRQWGGWAQSVYGWQSAKEAHNTWLQTSAELGFPGAIALLACFGFTAKRLLPLARGRIPGASSDDENMARMVICGLVGFFVASQFITAYGLEVSYHVAVLGAGLLRLRSREEAMTSPVAEKAARAMPVVGPLARPGTTR